MELSTNTRSQLEARDFCCLGSRSPGVGVRGERCVGGSWRRTLVHILDRRPPAPRLPVFPGGPLKPDIVRPERLHFNLHLEDLSAEYEDSYA